MDEWNVLEQDKIRLLGRSDCLSGVFHMDWTGSCIEFILKGSHAQIQLTAVSDGREQWVLFEIDGIPSARVRLHDGTHWYTVLSSRGYPKSHRFVAAAKRRIRIFKETQAHYGDKNATTSCDRIRVDGELFALPVRKRIEFIGDSMTSGEGAISPRLADIGSAVSIDEWSTSYYAWPGYTSRLLDVDFQILSQGGWGTYCGWDNNMFTAIPSIYDRICGVISQPWAAARGADKPYDFSFHPDVIVLNMGTNDDSAFVQPAWVHPVTGLHFKLRRVDEDTNPDSYEYVKEDQDKVIEAMVSFVELIAEKNPDTPILWSYGMMGQGMWATIEKAKNILHTNGLTQFDTIFLPLTPSGDFGANSHPLAAHHERCAHIIAARIRTFLI